MSYGDGPGAVLAARVLVEVVSAAVNRRPRLELHGASATPEEAAAVIAAIEQFLRDTAPAPAPVEPAPNPWVRAALLEGVERAPQREPW